jgi:cytochrome c-type biogenesis protein CcmE
VLVSPTEFRADNVLAKHDENYMPREVADALKKQGHWEPGGKLPDLGAKTSAEAKK